MLHHFVVTAVAATSFSFAPAEPERKTAQPPPGVQANYYGTAIDLSKGWRTAQACATDGSTTECFDTEAELDRHLAETQNNSDGLDDSLLATCATSTRLYAGTSYGTPVLAVSQRLSWYNLASAGFDNRTRSYKIGSCAAALAKNSGGGGGFYPGSTSAGAQSSTMASGWDRVVSSVYHY